MKAYRCVLVMFMLTEATFASGQNPPSRPAVQPQRPQPQPQPTRPSVQPPRPQPPIGHTRPPSYYRPPGWRPDRPAYTRPPHYYGGNRFYTYHRYTYHPYNPYIYGPAWHPVGFFLGAIAATASYVAFNNMQYRYYQGVYYMTYNGGYQVVPPPMNIAVPNLPPGFITMNIGNTLYYYYGGVFYIYSQNGYLVVRAPAGALVPNLPDGCEQIQANGIVYLKYYNTFFQPISYNGQNIYEVVEME